MNATPSDAATGTDEPPVREAVLVTGFPAFTAKRMVAKCLGADLEARVCVLVPPAHEADAHAFLATLPAAEAGRAEVVIGDVCSMDLGLSGNEYKSLAAEITAIYHLAGVYHMGVDKATARQVNVEGTRGILDFAAEANQLRRLCHWSTAAVAGKRRGLILEDELDQGQSFHNIYEETKFEAEALARRAQHRMPITIVRPSIIVGDSRTGEIDTFDGPYFLMVLIVTNITHMRLPLPGRGTAPLNLVPIDFVIDAAYALCMDERAAGKTFHLTDPNPLSARRVYELVAERSHSKPPRGYIPGKLTRLLLRAPGMARLASNSLPFFELFDQQVFYNCRHTQELLADTEIRCPPFDAYVDTLVQYVKEVHAARRQQRGQYEEPDPLD